MGVEELLAVSRGERESDLLLTGARIVNVCTGRVDEGSVAVRMGKGV